MLSSFEIVNFRAFQHLRIERLGRVNLIVGKNGVGKTTFLEAMRFYGMGDGLALREYLAEQQEWAAESIRGENLLDIRALFHGRATASRDMKMGPMDDDSLRLHVQMGSFAVSEKFGQLKYDEVESGAAYNGDVVTAATLSRGGFRVLIGPTPSHRVANRGRYPGPALVRAGGVPEGDLTYWWDSITLTDAEERVQEMLSLLDGRIEDVAASADPSSKAGARIFKVRLRGERTPVALKSLGDGLGRIFQIAVALGYSGISDAEQGQALIDKAGEIPWPSRFRFLLIDEIENGIHYSVHPDLWRAVFRLAESNNVQVFATTHSWDCVKGFAEALKDAEPEDGLMIRLEKAEGQERTGAVIIDRDDLPIVVRESIEVR